MTAAKLFETGCVFCGYPERQTYGRSGRDYRYCGDCLVRYDGGWGKGGAGIDAEYDRRKSPPAADRPWVPAVGEMCEGIGCVTEKKFGPLPFVAFSTCNGQETALLRCKEPHTTVQVTRSSLRPASRPSLPEAQFYGTCPPRDELPETLPDGTLCTQKFRHYGLRLTSRRGGYSYHQAVREGCEPICNSVTDVGSIDWSTVPRQATHPPAPERNHPHGSNYCAHAICLLDPCVACGRGAKSEPSRPAEAKVDPYKQVRDAHDAANRHAQTSDAEGRELRIAALTASPDPLARLAAARAKRSAHVEAHRSSFDVPARVRRDKLGRPVPTGHPISWPEQGED